MQALPIQSMLISTMNAIPTRSQKPKLNLIPLLLGIALGTLFPLANSSRAALAPGLALQVTNSYGAFQTILTVTGLTGLNCTLQYTSDLADTNSWQSMTNFHISTGTNVIYDSPTPSGSRFYRVAATYPNPPEVVSIAPGTFTMGCPMNEPGTFQGYEDQHTVTLTQGFYMGKYLVTAAEYQAILGTNIYGYSTNLTQPMTLISWSAAADYCAYLTQIERAAGKIPTNWSYRLPTESEWEYACRAGTTTIFYLGNILHGGDVNFDSHHEYNPAPQNYNGDVTVTNAIGYVGAATPVGSYAPNPWGLYDMCGNVYEWCQDWFAAYPTGSVVNPQGPGDNDFHYSSKILRGGSFNDYGRSCRSGARGGYDPTHFGGTIGFRVVLAPPPQLFL